MPVATVVAVGNSDGESGGAMDRRGVEMEMEREGEEKRDDA